MGLRLRKSFKLFSSSKLNISKTSVSHSLGTKGLSLSTGTKGTFLNVSIPNTGISYRRKLFKKERDTSHSIYQNNAGSNVMEGAITLGVIIGAIVFWASGSFLLSFVPVFIIPMLLAFQKNTQEVSNHAEKTLHSKDTHERYIKRQERAQQQLKRIIISQGTKIEETKEEADLLQLLEVDNI